MASLKKAVVRLRNLKTEITLVVQYKTPVCRFLAMLAVGRSNTLGQTEISQLLDGFP